jgi:hypothetical protein
LFCAKGLIGANPIGNAGIACCEKSIFVLNMLQAWTVLMITWTHGLLGFAYMPFLSWSKPKGKTYGMLMPMA